MFFHQRFVPGLAIASYMVGDEKAKQLAVIDPTRDVDEYIQIAKAEPRTTPTIVPVTPKAAPHMKNTRRIAPSLRPIVRRMPMSRLFSMTSRTSEATMLRAMLRRACEAGSSQPHG